MSINKTDLIKLLKTTPYPVFRDKAHKDQKLPYIVYSYESGDNKRASGRIYRRIQNIQVSLFTKGTEDDFLIISALLDANNVAFGSVFSIQGDENDDTISNVYMTVRCIDE